MKKDEKLFHSCPYREDLSGFRCALECSDECPMHPDYEPKENYSDALNQAYDAGWEQGYKKGYIQAMEDEDAWVDEEDKEDFEPIEWKVSDMTHTTLKTYGLSEYEEDEEDYEIYEKLFQSGDLEPEVAKAYEIGKNYGFDLGLAECSSSMESSYLEGYKDAITGEPCFIEDEEIEDILEDIRDRKKEYNLSYDTEFLSLVKEIQKNVCQLHKYSDNQEFKRSTYDILHLLTELTQLMVMKPVYDYWVRLEDIED